MQHCTNCGAAAREGAKFCTSCGVRLEPGVTLEEAPRDESQETATVYTVGPETIQESETRSDEADATTADSPETAYQASRPDPEAASRQAEEEDAGASAAPSDGGDSGWPDPETSETAGEALAEPGAETDDRPAGWGSADTEASADTDTEEDSSGWDTGIAEPEGPHRDAGASEWEGWSSTPAPESAVHHHEDEGVLRDIRELVDALQRRLDRLADPAPLSARGVDADELADRLGDWASEGPASDDLLWVIRDVRANPRDIDAVTRLADRAEDLEWLVERYGTICTDAQRWVARLRHTGDGLEA